MPRDEGFKKRPSPVAVLPARSDKSTRFPGSIPLQRMFAVKIKEWLDSGHRTTDLDNAFVWVLLGIIGAAVVCAATVQILVRLFY
jgi:hypothetical protein